MNTWKLISLVLFVLLVAVSAWSLMTIAAPKGYTVVMSNCDEALALMGAHIGSFVSLDEAKEWADENLGYQYDIASIYALDAPNRLSELLWLRSDGCFEGQYLDWTSFQSQ